MKVAAVQLNSREDKEANLAVADRLTRAAAADGAELVVLPEKWTVLGSGEHLRAGAEPLDGPAIAWARATPGRPVWSPPRSRTGVFSARATRPGSPPPHHRSGGRSMIVDPWGVVLAQAPDSVCHIVAELDLERQEQIRQDLPALANRRPAAYAWPQEARI